jgi:hypothetical protein
MKAILCRILPDFWKSVACWKVPSFRPFVFVVRVRCGWKFVWSIVGRRTDLSTVYKFWVRSAQRTRCASLGETNCWIIEEQWLFKIHMEHTHTFLEECGFSSVKNWRYVYLPLSCKGLLAKGLWAHVNSFCNVQISQNRWADRRRRELKLCSKSLLGSCGCVCEV